MAEVTFIYNCIPTIIQCKKTDPFKDICQKFAFKLNLNVSDLYFLYDGKVVNINLTLEKLSKESDIKDGRLSVLVYDQENKIKSENIEVSKNIICPICKDNCFIKLNEYQISLECKNEHKHNDILFDEYENYQKIDLSKIECNDCKNVNKLNSYEHQFFTCLTCAKNLCPLCKSKHNNKHDIIDYDQKLYICSNHNDSFSSYCKKCKMNLCIECESKHKDKENIILYRDLLPQKDLIKTQMKDLRIKIDKYKEALNKLKQELNNVISNLEIYYTINDNIIQNYERKNRNYQMLTNFKEIIKNNDIILKDLNNLNFDNKSPFDIFNKTINIYNKMKNIRENHSYDSGKNETNMKWKIKNEKNKNGFDKLIYLAMICEEANKYDDMLIFMKNFILQNTDIEKISNNNKDLIKQSFKNSIKGDVRFLRAIIDREKKEKQKENSIYLPYILEYKKFVLNELIEKYKNNTNFIENQCLPKAKEEELRGLYYQILGDYNRYIAEFIDDSSKNNIMDKCEKYYSEAEKILNKFSYLNFTKIGVSLNFSIFYHDIKRDVKTAIDKAKATIQKFEEIQKKHNINSENEEYKDSFICYQHLKENLETWEKEDE